MALGLRSGALGSGFFLAVISNQGVVGLNVKMKGTI